MCPHAHPSKVREGARGRLVHFVRGRFTLRDPSFRQATLGPRFNVLLGPNPRFRSDPMYWSRRPWSETYARRLGARADCEASVTPDEPSLSYRGGSVPPREREPSHRARPRADMRQRCRRSVIRRVATNCSCPKAPMREPRRAWARTEGIARVVSRGSAAVPSCSCIRCR